MSEQDNTNIKTENETTESTGQSVEQKKGKGKRVFLILLILFLLGGGIGGYLIYRTPLVQFKLSGHEMFQKQDDYSILDGMISFFEIHSSGLEQGEINSDVKFNASSDGTHMDPMIASTINQWAIHRNTKKSDGKSMTEIVGQYDGKEDPIVSTYVDNVMFAMKLFDEESYLSFHNGQMNEGLFNDEKDEGWEYFSKKMRGILGGKGQVNCFSSESGSFQLFPQSDDEPIRCKKVYASLTGEQMKLMLTDMCDLVLQDEKLFQYFNAISYDNEAESKARLQELKSFFDHRLEDSIQLAFYRKGLRTLGVSLDYVSSTSDFEVHFALTRQKKEDGYQRKLWASIAGNSVFLTSRTEKVGENCGDEGSILYQNQKDSKGFHLDYTLTHEKAGGNKGDTTYLQDNIILKNAEGEENYSISIENRLEQENYENYDLSKAKSNIMFDRPDLTFVIEIVSTLDGTSRPEVNTPESLQKIIDESGRVNGELFAQKGEEVLNHFWLSNLYLDLSSRVTIPKEPIIRVMEKFLSKFTTGQVTIKNPDDEVETEEETTEFVYVPPEEEEEEEEIRTWEEITNDPQYSKDVWDRFWGYYLSDEGVSSERHDNIVDYFYDFLEKYY